MFTTCKIAKMRGYAHSLQNWHKEYIICLPILQVAGIMVNYYSPLGVFLTQFVIAGNVLLCHAAFRTIFI